MRLSALCLPLLLLLGTPVAAQTLTLDYLCRYNCQSGEPDHLMAVAGLSGNRALAAGNRGIALVDLGALPVGGTQTYLYRLKGTNVRNLYVTPDEKHIYVNTHRGESTGNIGFDIVRLTGNTLTKAGSITETDVLYEKMCIDGSWLYVAAHSGGLRIYDITNREQPTLTGKLTTGFTDAFAVAVEGNTAYVADGAGGLKIVDVTNKAAPRITAGETAADAVGTYEDVTLRQGIVYVAAGGAGLAVYEAGKLHTRTLYPLPGVAESLCWVGDRLAVGTIAGTVVYRLGGGTTVLAETGDTAHRRGTGATLRFAEDVAPASSNRLLVAGWNFMDVYQLKAASASTQADIECDTQRIRFAATGGKHTVTVSNKGAADLTVTSVQSSNALYTASWSGGTLKPGVSITFDVTFKGTTANSAGMLRLSSNDPDESPLPIQLFGRTAYLDPGEAGINFTAQTLTRDPKTGKAVAGPNFKLSDHKGKVIWFNIFATW